MLRHVATAPAPQPQMWHSILGDTLPSPTASTRLAPNCLGWGVGQDARTVFLSLLIPCTSHYSLDVEIDDWMRTITLPEFRAKLRFGVGRKPGIYLIQTSLFAARHGH